MNTNDAVKRLRSGNVIAYPTEYCFGIGCLADNEKGLRRIRTIKQRPEDSAFIIIGHTIEQFYPYVGELSQDDRRTLENAWPAAITFLVPAARDVSPLLTGKLREVAIRIPDHALARKLCEEAGSAIVSTSANRRGKAPLKTAAAVRKELGHEVDFIVNAPCGKYNKPSTIIRLADDTVIRK